MGANPGDLRRLWMTAWCRRPSRFRDFLMAQRRLLVRGGLEAFGFIMLEWNGWIGSMPTRY